MDLWHEPPDEERTLANLVNESALLAVRRTKEIWECPNSRRLSRGS